MNSKQLISIAVFCIYLAAVGFLCFAKPDDLPQVPTMWFGIPADKAGHFLMFIPFPILSYMVFGNPDSNRLRQMLKLLAIMCMGIGLAIGTEQIQAQLAYRQAEFMDLYADAAGLVFGVMITTALIIYRKKR